jgi:uncharacterized membrane protein
VTTQEEINEREWHKADNWGRFGIYRSRLDTRALVPKRRPWMGMTINFAHAQAWLYLLGLSIVPLGFVLLFLLIQIAR